MNYHLPVSVVRAATAAALLASIAVTALFASSQQASSADTYPSRRITFVVPYPAGGATDVLARLLANKLSESWKQTVVVENKSGGGGVVGNDNVAKAQPDGYTVLIAITQIIQAPSLVAKLPYDVFKDLAPVTQIALSTIVLVVPEQQPIKSVKELVDLCQGEPRQALRHLRQCHDVASLRRIAQEDRQYRYDPCSLSRLGSADE